jgi:hypothetical protein
MIRLDEKGEWGEAIVFDICILESLSLLSVIIVIDQNICSDEYRVSCSFPMIYNGRLRAERIEHMYVANSQVFVNSHGFCRLLWQPHAW